MSLDAAPAPRPSLLGRLFGQDRWIPWLFVLGFLVLFAVTGSFVKLALTSFTGLVATNAYERGLAYDDVIAAERAQAEQGWRMTIATPALSGEGQEMRVELVDRTGAPLSGGAVHVLAERMSRYAQQVRFDLVDVGNGTYAAPVDFPIGGRWLVSVLAEVDGRRHFETEEIILEAPGVN